MLILGNFYECDMDLWLSQGLFNLFGHYVLPILDGSTYILYVGSYLLYNSIFVITADGILGTLTRIL